MKEVYDLKQIQKRMQTNPNVQNIVKNKKIQQQTFLSPYTIVENSVVGLTTDHVLNKANRPMIGRARKERRSMLDLLKDANW